MRLDKIRGFIVYSFPLGEADQIITCFSSSGNLVKFMAKGSRKVKSRFAAPVQLFNLGEYVLYRGRGLPFLRQAEIIDSFNPIRRDWTKSGSALAAMELCRLLIGEETREDRVFQLVLAYFYNLREKYSSLAFDAFRLQFVARLGYGMEFDHCISCGRNLDAAWVSWEAGGALCDRCRQHGSGYVHLEKDMLQLLGKLQLMDLNEVDKVDGHQYRQQCAAVVDSLIFWLTEGKTKAQAFRKLFDSKY